MFTRDVDVVTAVRERGWTRQRRQAFLRQYGSLLRHGLPSELGKRFGAGAIYGLRDSLTGLERGQTSNEGDACRPVPGVDPGRLTSTLLGDVCSERNTIEQYDAYRGKREQAAKVVNPLQDKIFHASHRRCADRPSTPGVADQSGNGDA